MFTVLLILQVFLGAVIIALVLLQQGKGADMGAAFGAGASGTVFGSRGGSSFFTRATAVLATLFFANSILLSSPIVRDVEDVRSSVTESLPALEQEQDQELMVEEQEVLLEEPTASDLPPADLPDMPVPLDEPVSDLPPAEESVETTDSVETAVPEDRVNQDESIGPADGPAQ
jgi:preprotein translocase subunit SecG